MSRRAFRPSATCLQHDGIARAFETAELIDAIAAMPGGIEALVLEWSDPDKIAITVGWTRITEQTSAAAFAAAVRATKRSSHGLTAIGSALLAAAAAFDHMPEPAGHRVIDVSGDGMANFGVPPARPRATRSSKPGSRSTGSRSSPRNLGSTTITGNNVIGGPGAFCIVAKDFRQLCRRDAAQTGAGGAAVRHPRSVRRLLAQMQ